MKRVDEQTVRDVMELFRAGYAPSEIDAMLGLPEGTAHDAVLRFWRSMPR